MLDSGCFFLEDRSSGCVACGLRGHRCSQKAMMGQQSRLCCVLSNVGLTDTLVVPRIPEAVSGIGLD